MKPLVFLLILWGNMADYPLVSYPENKYPVIGSTVESFDDVIRAKQTAAEYEAKGRIFPAVVEGLTEGYETGQRQQINANTIEQQQAQLELQQKQIELTQLKLEKAKLDEINNRELERLTNENAVMEARRKNEILKQEPVVKDKLANPDPAVRASAFESQFSDYWSNRPDYLEEALSANWIHLTPEQREIYSTRLSKGLTVKARSALMGGDPDAEQFQKDKDAVFNDAGSANVYDNFVNKKRERTPGLKDGELQTDFFSNIKLKSIEELDATARKNLGIDITSKSPWHAIYTDKDGNQTSMGGMTAEDANRIRKAQTTGMKYGLLGDLPPIDIKNKAKEEADASGTAGNPLAAAAKAQAATAVPSASRQWETPPKGTQSGADRSWIGPDGAPNELGFGGGTNKPAELEIKDESDQIVNQAKQRITEKYKDDPAKQQGIFERLKQKGQAAAAPSLYEGAEPTKTNAIYSPEEPAVAELVDRKYRRSEIPADIRQELKRSEPVLKQVEANPILKNKNPVIKAVAAAESAGKNNAKSHTGVKGLMQVTGPAVKDANKIALQKYGRLLDPKKPADNVELGTLYLGKMLDTFKGNLTLAFGAYNGGPGLIKRIQSEVGSDWDNISSEIERMGSANEFYERKSGESFQAWNKRNVARAKEIASYPSKVYAYLYHFGSKGESYSPESKQQVKEDEISIKS